MALQPLNDRVILEPTEAASQTPGGILLPDTAKEKPVTGKVVAVGPGLMDHLSCTRTPMSVTVGDIVLYGKYSGNEVEHDGKKLVMLHENELFAKII